MRSNASKGVRLIQGGGGNVEGGGREKVGKMSDCNGQQKPRFEGPIFVSGDCIGHFETCIVSLSSKFV
jgi:hypothetical protein